MHAAAEWGALRGAAHCADDSFSTVTCFATVLTLMAHACMRLLTGVRCAAQRIALTVNEELDLHHRLLEDLDEDVEVTHSRMRAAQKKLKHVMQRAGNCRSMCVMIALMVALAVVIIIAFKLASLFH